MVSLLNRLAPQQELGTMCSNFQSNISLAAIGAFALKLFQLIVRQFVTVEGSLLLRQGADG